MASKNVKTVLGCIRRADEQFHMVEEGDHILVGVSGGKDSLTLLYAMGLYRKFFPGHFTLSAATLDMGLKPIDTDAIAALCREMDVPYTVHPTGIGPVLFETRKESNPCSLCAKMRRGALHELARSQGCNKVALGHHREDVLETMLMSLLYEGRINTFQPVTWMDRCDIVQIRPMVFVPEKLLIATARQLNLPVQTSPCPMAGHTNRQRMKELLAHLHTIQPDAENYMIQALRSTGSYHLWDKCSGRPDGLPRWWLEEDGVRPDTAQKL